MIKVLRDKFDNDLDTSNKKALKVKPNGNRRSADVLVCQDFRLYTKYTGTSNDYTTGIGFQTTDGELIQNYPKLHSQNLTKRHQESSQWLKPTVRIFKNMRNKLIADRKIVSGVAPSYYLEGLFWNAPLDVFGPNYNTTVFNCLNWMSRVNAEGLVCANGMLPLLGDDSPVRWPNASFRIFRAQSIDLWNNWGK